jgi:hypothetical protein
MPEGNKRPAADFQRLQDRLVVMWHQIGARLTDRGQGKHTVVVIPSLSLDLGFDPSTIRLYEERMLFMLFLLREPEIDLVFVTSEPVRPEVVDYYLQLIPGIVISNARRRLKLVCAEDSSPAPLSRKLLERPHLLREIRSRIGNPENVHIVPYNTTELERELALRLDVPMYAADPRFVGLGTKTGCRRLFAEEGIRHPEGSEDLHSLDEVVSAILAVRSLRPNAKKVVAKLNEGASGLGNLVIDLPAADIADASSAVRERLLHQASQISESAESLDARIKREGAVVEEFVSGSRSESPSAQLRVTPLGEVELLSTHDQILGGEEGQSYIGAVFPANPEYSRLISKDAMKIGQRLAREGILGRFAVDFVVILNEAGHWESYAIEVNLRKGGTTAPFLILQYLTDGYYDVDQGVFLTAEKDRRYYVASDHVESESYRLLTIGQLFDIVSTCGLHFNHAERTGVVMHMISGIGELGRVGITAIGRSPEHARQLFDEFVSRLQEEAVLLSEGA